MFKFSDLKMNFLSVSLWIAENRNALVYLHRFSSNQSQENWKVAFVLIINVLIFYHHHNHYVVPLARISLTISRHFSLSLITSGRSSGLHPISSHSCCMYVQAGHPVFARPYVGVHRSTSHELVPASPAVSCMSGLSDLDSFRDGRQVAV